MRIREPENVLLWVPVEMVSRLKSALTGMVAEVWISPAELPSETRPDVVIIEVVIIAADTDRTLADSPQLSGAGIVVIGHDPADTVDSSRPAADVVLPADFTDRELRIAVQLTARLARLRSELAAGARREADVRQIADTDPLTGLANRRAWERYLGNLVQDSATMPRWLAVIDLDQFKQVNDALGMARADDVLRRAAQALAAQLRRDDLIARLGGDEFGVVLSQVNAADVQHVLERLRGAVSATCAQAGAEQVSASIGYVPFEANTMDKVEWIMAAAEKAMRAAKQLGGNCVVLGSPECAPGERNR